MKKHAVSVLTMVLASVLMVGVKAQKTGMVTSNIPAIVKYAALLIVIFTLSIIFWQKRELIHKAFKT